MLALAAAVLALASPLELTPTDDVWVYPHAADQTSDPYIRAWGGEEGAVGKFGTSNLNFSYSCLKFDLSGAKGEVESATLVLWSIPKPAYTTEDSKAGPIEARRLDADFNEANWKIAMAEKVIPKAGDDQIFGAAPVVSNGDDEPIRVEIDLMKGKGGFAAAWKAAIASPNKTLCMAITSKLNPEEAGEGKIYKLFSRSAENKSLRPKLVVKLSDKY